LETDKKQFTEIQKEFQQLSELLQDKAKIMAIAKADMNKAQGIQSRAQQLHGLLPQIRNKIGRSMHLLDLKLGDSIGIVQDCTSSAVLSDNNVKGGTVTYIPKHYSFIVCPFEYVMQRWEEREDWEFRTCIAENGQINTTTRESNEPHCLNVTRTKTMPANAQAQMDQCDTTANQEERSSCKAHFKRVIADQMENGLKTFLGVYNKSASVPNRHHIYTGQDTCQNGQKRSVNVTLSCGAAGSPRGQALNHTQPGVVAVGERGKSLPPGLLDPDHSSGRIIHAYENGMCNYEILLETPLACGAAPPGMVEETLGDSVLDRVWDSAFGALETMFTLFSGGFTGAISIYEEARSAAIKTKEEV